MEIESIMPSGMALILTPSNGESKLASVARALIAQTRQSEQPRDRQAASTHSPPWMNANLTKSGIDIQFEMKDFLVP